MQADEWVNDLMSRVRRAVVFPRLAETQKDCSKLRRTISKNEVIMSAGICVGELHVQPSIHSATTL